MTIENDVDFAVGLGAVRELLERQGINPSEVGRLHRIKDVRIYQGQAKVPVFDEEGRVVKEEVTVTDMASVVLSPKWEDGPEWPVIQPGPAFKLAPPKKGVKIAPYDWETCVVWPDIQIGYYRGKGGELVSTHDEVAIGLALGITADVNPDLVVLVGDNLDLPNMGKYRVSPAFRDTTQASIDYATQLMFDIRVAAPNARIVWIAGNHEERMVNYLLDNAEAAFGLKQGGRPDSWPVLSVPFLCRLDEVGIEYLAGYPANELWINERLRVIHGTRVKSTGSTSHEYLRHEKTSIIYGHIHRREWNETRFPSWGGSKTILAASPGTLAKVDGAVPSTKGGIDLDGRPLTVVENWQQGIAVVRYQTGDNHKFFYDQVPFIEHEALYNGKLYTP